MASVPLVGTIACCISGFLSDKSFRNRRELLVVLGHGTQKLSVSDARR
ncbi:hypothetical protein HDG38_006601 [Paraburkholderia sp. WSM4177]|nr:hypothetical protein [Paraburkholderia sp. WSM4177]MBB5488370.1 hypothetical protein [Paraburkholderia sp. WSM4180]